MTSHGLAWGALGLAVLSAAATSAARPASAASPSAAVPSGTLALTPDHMFSLPLSGYSTWAMDPDGTFYTANIGTIGHYDDQGNNLGDGFAISSNSLPGQLGTDTNRLYLSYSTQSGSQGVLAYAKNGGTGQQPTGLDGGTVSRYDGQVGLRVVGGNLFLPTGQRNKIGLVSLSSFATSPFYPQSWYGQGINDTSPAPSPAWESCDYDGGGGAVNGAPANCGTGGGTNGTDSVLSYPTDIAVGDGGSLLVLNSGSNGNAYGGNDVEVLAGTDTGYVPGRSFGTFGSGDGQLNQPTSIVRDPASGDIFISDSGNDRISEFTGDGDFLASFGYGVLDGSDTWETCGVNIGTCQAGLDYYYGHLEVNAGQLFVEGVQSDGKRGQIQVLDLSDGGTAAPTPSPTGSTPPSTPVATSNPLSGPGVPSPAGTQPGPTAPATTPSPVAQPIAPAAQRNTVRLKVNHTRVASAARVSLTATVGPSAHCSGRGVLFQILRGRSWLTLSRTRTNRVCSATLKSPAITGTSKFRAILLSPARATLAASPMVTIKLKN